MFLGGCHYDEYHILYIMHIIVIYINDYKYYYILSYI